MNLHLLDVTSSYTFVLSGSTTCNVHLFRQRVVTHESILDDTGPPCRSFLLPRDKDTGTLVDPFAEENDVRFVHESVTWFKITAFDRIEPLSSSVDAGSDESTCVRAQVMFSLYSSVHIQVSNPSDILERT